MNAHGPPGHPGSGQEAFGPGNVAPIYPAPYSVDSIPGTLPGAGEPKPADQFAEYGLQAPGIWAAGNGDPIVIVDMMRGEWLWAVRVFGEVDLTITYGTSGGARTRRCRAPLAAQIPGNVAITATPINSDTATTCAAMVTKSSGAPSIMRSPPLTAPANLPEGASNFVALTAATVNVNGSAVVLAAGAQLPIQEVSILTVGTGFVEFQP